MKVQATINLGLIDYPNHPLTDGEVAEVPEAVGKAMVARGHAVRIEEPEPPQEVSVAVEAQPSATVAKTESKPASSKPEPAKSTGKK